MKKELEFLMINYFLPIMIGTGIAVLIFSFIK